MDKKYVLEIINIPGRKEPLLIPMEKVMPYIPEGVPMSQVVSYIYDAVKWYSEHRGELSDSIF